MQTVEAKSNPAACSAVYKRIREVKGDDMESLFFITRHKVELGRIEWVND